MRSYGGLLVGAMGLAVLDAVVRTSKASSNVGGWLSGAGALVKRFLDPTIPLFNVTTTTATTSSTSGAATATTVAATAPAGASTSVGPFSTLSNGSVPAFV